MAGCRLLRLGLRLEWHHRHLLRGADFDILTDGKGVFDTEFIKDLQYGWTSFLKAPPVPGAQGSDLGERCGRGRVPGQHGRIGSLDVLLRHGSDGVLQLGQQSPQRRGEFGAQLVLPPRRVKVVKKARVEERGLQTASRCERRWAATR